MNGLPTVAVEAIHVDRRQRTNVLARFVERGEHVLVFLGLVGSQDYPARQDGLRGLLDGVAPVEDSRILAVEPLRVRVVQAPVAGNLATVLGELGVTEEEWQETSFMNGRDLQDHVAEGDWLKVVR